LQTGENNEFLPNGYDEFAEENGGGRKYFSFRIQSDLEIISQLIQDNAEQDIAAILDMINIEGAQEVLPVLDKIAPFLRSSGDLKRLALFAQRLNEIDCPVGRTFDQIFLENIPPQYEEDGYVGDYFMDREHAESDVEKRLGNKKYSHHDVDGVAPCGRCRKGFCCGSQ
jgi:hypothetical protein